MLSLLGDGAASLEGGLDEIDFSPYAMREVRPKGAWQRDRTVLANSYRTLAKRSWMKVRLRREAMTGLHPRGFRGRPWIDFSRSRFPLKGARRINGTRQRREAIFLRKGLERVLIFALRDHANSLERGLDDEQASPLGEGVTSSKRGSDDANNPPVGEDTSSSERSGG